MSINDTWMPLYLGDYLADTGHLSTAEHGAYLLLLMHYWRNGPLPDDQSALMRIVRAQSAEWRKIKVNVLAFFTVEGDGLLHQKRIDQERDKCGVISEKRREAGRAGAKAKWRPNGEHPPPDPCEGMANAIPSGGKCHPVAIDLPPSLLNGCQPFATTPVPSKNLNILTYQGVVSPPAREELPSEAAVRSARRAFSAEIAELPDGLGSVIQRLGGKLGHVEYAPGRSPMLSREEQADTVRPKARPKTAYLSREQLAVARQPMVVRRLAA